MTYTIKQRQVEPPELQAEKVSVSTYEDIAGWLGAFNVDLKMKLDGSPNELVFFTPSQSISVKEGCWIIKDPSLQVPYFTITDEEFKKRYRVLVPAPSTTPATTA